MKRIPFFLLVFLFGMHGYGIGQKAAVPKSVSKYFFEIHGSLDYSSRYMHTRKGHDEFQFLVDVYDRLESPGMGYMTGVSFGRRFGKVDLSLGAMWSGRNTRICRDGTQYQWGTDNDNGTYGGASKGSAADLSEEVRYSNRFIEFPISLRPWWGAKYLSIDLIPGYYRNTRYTYSSQGITNLDKSHVYTEHVDRFVLSMALSGGWRVLNKRHWNVLLGPRLYCQILGLKSDTVMRNFWSMGLVGIFQFDASLFARTVVQRP